jgi:hypothetical protein
MTKIALIGGGRVAVTLASGFKGAGHELGIGVRNPDGWSSKFGDLKLSASRIPDVAAWADVVINATPGDVSLEVLSSIERELGGKILIDVANATRRGADGLPAGLLYAGVSLAEALQQALPDTLVVKTLNTMLFSVMTRPGSLGIPPSVFISGDDHGAKKVARGLLGDIGWHGEWMHDLGDLSSARGTEAMILLVPYIFKTYGPTPFAISIAR